jgi:hypothetical protein
MEVYWISSNKTDDGKKHYFGVLQDMPEFELNNSLSYYVQSLGDFLDVLKVPTCLRDGFFIKDFETTQKVVEFLNRRERAIDLVKEGIKWL